MTPPPPLACSRCGRALMTGRSECYLVEVRAVADPSPPVFDLEDLESDVAPAIQQLLGRLRALTPEELAREVYARRLGCLCASCYRTWSADPFGSRSLEGDAPGS